jgi:hypothetical protein
MYGWDEDSLFAGCCFETRNSRAVAYLMHSTQPHWSRQRVVHFMCCEGREPSAENRRTLEGCLHLEGFSDLTIGELG